MRTFGKKIIQNDSRINRHKWFMSDNFDTHKSVDIKTIRYLKYQVEGSLLRGGLFEVVRQIRDNLKDLMS